MSENVFERLVKTQRLPSPSATAIRILELADKKDVSIGEISDAIATDPAISARLLKYANSPLVAASGDVTTIRQAVMTLGVRTVKVTALSFSLVRKQDFSKCPRFNYDVFWAHSAATAVAARGILAMTRPARKDEAFVSGLLARIGKLAFATAIPQEYDAVLTKLGNVMRGGTAEERATFGTDNIAVGAELLSRWKLPSVLVDTVRYQTEPNSAPNPEVVELSRSVMQGRLVADVICGLVGRETLASLPENITSKVDEFTSQFRELAKQLDISLKDLPEADEIAERAKDLLEEMSVLTHTENMAIAAKNEVLKTQATVDGLTGIGNRKAFDEHLAAEIERMRRYKHPMALLMIDVDHFKKINDTKGHPAGDAVLKAMGQCIMNTLRKCDFAGRYGGEEFGVIASETDAEGARQLAERLRIAIAQQPIKTPAGPVQVTVSIGVASLTGQEQGVDAAAIVSAADTQLYSAKKAGRNRCQFTKLGTAPARPAPAKLVASR